MTPSPRSLRILAVACAAAALAAATLIPASVALSQGAAAAPAKGDPVAGERLTTMCAGCHGIPGLRNAFPAVFHFPRLGGQHPESFVAALQAYRDGERDHPTMRAIAGALSESDMWNLAAFYARGGVAAPATATVAVPAGLEKRVEACAACHGKDGNSPAPAFPRLAGQHADYLLHTLRAYQRGTRKNAIMAAQVKDLTPAEMRALADFYSRQTGLTLKR